MRKVFEEYLMTIKPDVDLQDWQEKSGSIEKILQSTIFKPFAKNLDDLRNRLGALTKQRAGIGEALKEATAERTEWQEKLKGATTEEEKKLAQEHINALTAQIDKLNENSKSIDKAILSTKQLLKSEEASFGVFTKSLTKGAMFLGVFASAVQQASNAAEKMAEKAEEVSNKFVTQASVVVDENIRNTMAKFGVDSSTAQAMTSASGALGYDLSDYAKWTNAQRKAFAELMREYQSGLNALNPEKLREYNAAVQEYQLMTAKFQLQTKLAITEMLVNSDGLEDVLGTLSETMEGLNALMTSEVFKTGFDLLMGIINGILKIATSPVRLIGGISGGSSNNTTYNTNVNTSVKTTNGINSEQLAVDIGLSVRNALSQG